MSISQFCQANGMERPRTASSHLSPPCGPQLVLGGLVFLLFEWLRDALL
jgi:hypothetical protein